MEEIARQVAKELNIEFYDKERIKEFALKHGFVSNKEVKIIFIVNSWHH